MFSINHTSAFFEVSYDHCGQHSVEPHNSESYTQILIRAARTEFDENSGAGVVKSSCRHITPVQRTETRHCIYYSIVFVFSYMHVFNISTAGAILTSPAAWIPYVHVNIFIHIAII